MNITFEKRLSKVEAKFGYEYLEAVGYIKIYWLERYKENIAKAWVKT